MRGEKERELSSLDEVPAEYRGILFSQAKHLGLEVMSIEEPHVKISFPGEWRLRI